MFLLLLEGTTSKRKLFEGKKKYDAASSSTCLGLNYILALVDIEFEEAAMSHWTSSIGACVRSHIARHHNILWSPHTMRASSFLVVV